MTFPVKVNTVTLTAIPLANPNRLTGATVTGLVLPGGGYRLGAAKSASVAINPAGNAKGTGLTGSYFQRTSSPSTYNAGYFTGTPTLQRLDPTVDFIWSATPAPGNVPPGLNAANSNYVAVWEGQVQPQYSETYYFSTLVDDGVKLWVNGQLLIDSWVGGSFERFSTITLRAGVRYDLRMEYFQGTGGAQAHLYWYSDSQTKQVIPSGRLYPKAGTQAPPAITPPPRRRSGSSTSRSASPSPRAVLGARRRPSPSARTAVRCRQD